MLEHEGVHPDVAHPDVAPWVSCVPGQPSYARCKFCKGTTISLSNMGVQSEE